MTANLADTAGTGRSRKLQSKNRKAELLSWPCPSDCAQPSCNPRIASGRRSILGTEDANSHVGIAVLVWRVLHDHGLHLWLARRQ